MKNIRFTVVQIKKHESLINRTLVKGEKQSLTKFETVTLKIDTEDKERVTANICGNLMIGSDQLGFVELSIFDPDRIGKLKLGDVLELSLVQRN